MFRRTSATSPKRHLEAAALLGADVRDALGDDAGAILSGLLVDRMRATGVPSGMSALGYEAADVAALARGAMMQKRLVDNAPMNVDEQMMRSLFERALSYG